MIVTALKGALYGNMIERYYTERRAAGDTPAKHMNFQEWLDARDKGERKESRETKADKLHEM